MSTRGNYFAKTFAVVVLACAAQQAAKATPINWLVTGFTFTDGSTIAGGAVYDAAANTYSDILVLATGGSTYNNIFYQYWNPSLPVSPDYITLVAGLPSSDLTGVPSLWILLDAPITGPAGSIVHSSFALQVLCADPTCSTVDSATLAASASGDVAAFPFATAVPEPSTAFLLPAAFLAFAGLKTIRARRNQPLS